MTSEYVLLKMQFSLSSSQMHHLVLKSKFSTATWEGARTGFFFSVVSTNINCRADPEQDTAYNPVSQPPCSECVLCLCSSGRPGPGWHQGGLSGCGPRDTTGTCRGTGTSQRKSFSIFCVCVFTFVFLCSVLFPLVCLRFPDQLITASKWQFSPSSWGKQKTKCWTTLWKTPNLFLRFIIEHFF